MRIKIEGDKSTYCPSLSCKNNISGHCITRYKLDEEECQSIKLQKAKKSFYKVSI